MSVVPFALDGFEMKPLTSSDGRKRDVFRTGSGPEVIVIHEVPVLTDPLGTPGRPTSHSRVSLSTFARVPMSREATRTLHQTKSLVQGRRNVRLRPALR